MAIFKFKVQFDAKVRGSYEGEAEVEGTPVEMHEEASRQAEHAIDQLMLDGHISDLNIDECDSTVTELETQTCSKCDGRKYLIDILDGGAGLLKVGPCGSCQGIPNTVEVCKHIIELLKEAHEEEAE